MKAVVASLLFCVVTLVIFVGTAVASRRELPVGLADVYGDTSGIHRLTIEGSVVSWAGRYAYDFHISPEGAWINMNIPRNAGTFADISLRHSWVGFWHGGSNFLQLEYIPIAPYEIVEAESENSFTIISGEWIPMTEHRIYGQVFGVVPRFSWHELYIPNEQSSPDGGLFVDLGEDGFIFSMSTEFDAPWEFWSMSSNFDWLMPSPGWLRHELRMGDVSVFVPIATGLFGETAVYVVRWSGNEMPYAEDEPVTYPLDGSMEEAWADLQPRVVAEVLFPIELERGTDHIRGLLELDGDVLLFISRAAGYEVTRISPYTGETITFTVEGEVFALHDFFLQEDSLVLSILMIGSDGIHTVFHAFCLSDGGLVHTASFDVEPDAADNSPIIHDALHRDGMLYIAFTTTIHSDMNMNQRTYVSTFDSHGQLVGRSQVMNGSEEDFTFFMRRNVVPVSSIYMRQTAPVSIR